MRHHVHISQLINERRKCKLSCVDNIQFLGGAKLKLLRATAPDKQTFLERDWFGSLHIETRTDLSGTSLTKYELSGFANIACKRTRKHFGATYAAKSNFRVSLPVRMLYYYNWTSRNPNGNGSIQTPRSKCNIVSGPVVPMGGRSNKHQI